MSLSSSIQYLKGVGPRKKRLFEKLGIHTIADLLYYLPRRYEDRRNFVPISKLKPNQAQTVKAQVIFIRERYTLKKRMHIFQLTVSDGVGRLSCLWFNQPYLKAYFNKGDKLILYGKVQVYDSDLQMVSAEYEVITDKKDNSLHLGRIVPIYPLTEGLSQRYFRAIVKRALDKSLPHLKDILPYELRSRYNLPNIASSILNIHFPKDFAFLEKTRQRIIFEEFFILQIFIGRRRRSLKGRKGIAHKIEGKLRQRFQRGLGFELTPSQRQVIKEIEQDMASVRAMQRLLQGDVGSGKTVVATLAAIIAIQGGYQVAFMVPTEVLSKQHDATLSDWLKPLKIRMGLLTSSLAKKKRQRLIEDIKSGKIQLILGTHALLEENIEFKNLGLVIIDEQHKFSVTQRSRLPKKGNNPDILIMTATPIPRTLALTIYGDLDISTIRELPQGRGEIKTCWIEEDKRQWVYQFIREKIKEGRQAYIVYPIIEESGELDIRAATQMYEHLKQDVFKDLRLGLVHGRMKSKQQQESMAKFKIGEIDILVSTTLLEVGIDVANAAVMVIENAERFGLSQLHQLRGRIGRGAYQSHCILISASKSPEAIARLKAMVSSLDGFYIAEEDLKIRGPGEFLGVRQHGPSELRIADPLREIELLKKARAEAFSILRIDPHLTQRNHLFIRELLQKRFPYKSLRI